MSLKIHGKCTCELSNLLLARHSLANLLVTLTTLNLSMYVLLPINVPNSLKQTNSSKPIDHSMEIKVEIEEQDIDNDQNEPLLQNKSLPEPEEKTLIQKAMSQTFKSTAHLANLLPTGSVLAFQLLSPIFTNEGECDSVSRLMTTGLICLCALSCILLTFTDSFKDKNGDICYGFVTFTGLWVIDGSTSLPIEEAYKYKIKFIDFMHAFMSVMVFISVALFDQNVVSCFYPMPSEGIKEVLTSLPVGMGVICSILFVVFPTKRHGIGFPVAAQ